MMYQVSVLEIVKEKERKIERKEERKDVCVYVFILSLALFSSTELKSHGIHRFRMENTYMYTCVCVCVCVLWS